MLCVQFSIYQSQGTNITCNSSKDGCVFFGIYNQFKVVFFTLWPCCVPTWPLWAVLQYIEEDLNTGGQPSSPPASPALRFWGLHGCSPAVSAAIGAAAPEGLLKERCSCLGIVLSFQALWFPACWTDYLSLNWFWARVCLILCSCLGITGAFFPPLWAPRSGPALIPLNRHSWLLLCLWVRPCGEWDNFTRSL